MATKGGRRTKDHSLLGNQTLPAQLLVNKVVFQRVRTPVEDQKLGEVVRKVLGHGKAGTQTRIREVGIHVAR